MEQPMPQQRSAELPADSRPRVVVGVDGSPGSRAALVEGWLTAARRGALLDVVAAVPPQHAWTGAAPAGEPSGDVRTDTVARARALVDEVVAEGLADAVQVRIRSVPGRPADVLVDAAEGAAALVVGSRGRGAVRSAVVGSVALHCVTHAHVPVEVVHAAPRTQASGVVVGVDGSPASLGALRAAIDEAALRGTAVRVLAAWDVATMWSDMYALTATEKNAVVTRLERAVDDAVTAAREEAASVLGPGTPRITSDVVEGPASDVLVSAADSAQLLVVGSRGHGAIRGLLLGSVALGCVVHAPGPVLVVPPPPRPAPAAAAAAPALAHT
jgi:nucleotide-binding universal stress UspA family protein